ncbi:hypothetical protein RclHR1_03110011 [Rhizophagus clarus]|uniref:Uncharacterized protein n=1 Tax=Rhizophagus clarus TaxID=94130 RepID=A0A2Z6RLH0_9GLOM|nr:hypothetical protein RclHR1_03110011 [Rhizophagus clarus]
MFNSIKRQNKRVPQREEVSQQEVVSQQEEISKREEIFSTKIDNTEPQKPNYKKYLTDFIEYANEGIHSSINSLQSINIIQKMSHIYEMPSFILSDDDLNTLTVQKFLKDYTLEDICNIINKYGIKKELEIKGYKDIIINFDTSDYFVHRLTITDKSLLNFTSAIKNINGQFLIDLFIRKKEFIVSDFKTYQVLRRAETFYEEFEDKHVDAIEVYKFMENQLNDKYSLYLIEWICMQDPHSEFSQSRPQLPGQNYPGLRISRKVGNMLIDLAHKGDGLSNIPEYFHNAYVYHTQDYIFLNPAFQAYFDCLYSLKNDLKVHGLSAVSWAFHNGHVKNINGEIEIWKPEEQVYPISSKLSLYFDSHGYKSLYNIFRKRGYQVSIDWNNAREIWKFSLNHEFEVINEVINDDTAENNIRNIHNIHIEDEKKNELDVIEDVANEHHQNEKKHIWITEKSRI